MRQRSWLTRTAASLFAALVAVGVTTACGSAGPGGAEDRDEIQLWTLQSEEQNPVLQKAIDDYSGTTKVSMTTYVNDPYKQKLQVSMGSAEAPDIFFNWGGGNLAQFVEAAQVVDLTDALAKNPGTLDKFLPSVAKVGQIDGKQYALPMNGIQPVVLFYNKEVFAKVGASPPKTYDDLLALVATFKTKGITPIALAGSQGWTELMYLEYLLDRVGGPDKFAAITADKPGAWSDPAVLKAVGMCQDLAKRGAFGTTFASVNYDNSGASKLFATGKAAMHLMGSWEYGNQLTNTPDFVKNGNLGWVPFPSVAGGAGDPNNIVGNPSNYFSVSAKSAHRDQAADFLIKTLTSDSYVTGMVAAGQVPAIKGVESRFTGEHAEFTKFVYQLVATAPAFTQSWDQALSPAAGTELNTNLQKLFISELTPEQFVSAMEKVG
jgi:raffinose/stachyose/melibiose transport system substrate-binding protein/xylobiose transport system substrate-binding protein